jgi:hypothetical protein
MYLRNVKQLIRQVSADFDERAYGFANLVDLLRAAGRENVVRVDRDRQGVIRVFQGNVATAAPEAARVIPFDIEDELAAAAAMASEVQAGEPPSETAADEPPAFVAGDAVVVIEETGATVDEDASESTEDEDEVNGNVIGPPKRTRRRAPAKSAGAAKQKTARPRKRR